VDDAREPAEGAREADLPDGADTATARPAIADPDPVDADELAQAQNEEVDSAGS